MLTYLSLAFTVLFPLYFVYHAWRSSFQTVTGWGLFVTNGLAALGVLSVIGRFDLIGISICYVLYGVYAVALLGSWAHVSDLPFLHDGRTGISWSTLSDTVALLLLSGWTLFGYWPNQSPVPLTFPLDGQDYYVVHGGGTYPINYHGLFAPSQRYAVDVTQLNDWGVRAAGLYPSHLGAYEIYGRPVYSPLDGTVVKAVDQFSDLTPGQRQTTHPAGNHVWIRRDSLYVLLAHLQGGSVRVTAGDRVRTGQPLAAVGNTGNTSEPHLHLHAVTVPTQPSSVPDSLLGAGTPVPVQFDGRFLTRNDQVTRARSPESPPAEHATLRSATYKEGLAHRSE